MPNSGTIEAIEKYTQEEFDELSTKSNTHLYVVSNTDITSGSGALDPANASAKLYCGTVQITDLILVSSADSLDVARGVENKLYCVANATARTISFKVFSNGQFLDLVSANIQQAVAQAIPSSITDFTNKLNINYETIQPGSILLFDTETNKWIAGQPVRPKWETV